MVTEKPLFRGPSNNLQELVLGGGIGRVVVVHGAGYPLADPVESQHVVAESHRQELREIFVLLEFGADVLGEQAVGDADRKRFFAPKLLQSSVVVRIDAESAGIHDAGDSETIELREELPGPGDVVFEIRP